MSASDSPLLASSQSMCLVGAASVQYILEGRWVHFMHTAGTHIYHRECSAAQQEHDRVLYGQFVH